MAFCHPIFALANQPIFSPNKCSAILGVKLIPEHAYCRCHSKNHFTIALKQNIHISKNGKDRDALQIRRAKALEEVKRELVRKARQNAAHDIFDKFWDSKGKLKQTLCDDIYGLIALFEASQLSIEGEDYLHEAEESSRQYLNTWLSRYHDHPQVKFVADSLRYPIHKSLSRFTPTILQLEKKGWTSSLQELSKIDTEMISSLHLKEISAVSKWDVAATEQLPDYMKGRCKALYDITIEFAFKTHIKHGWNPISTLIKSWVRLLNAFLEKAKWFAAGHVPKTEEYLKNAILSTGVHMILVHSFFFMGKDITEETATLMDEFPRVISTTATILRLCDDLEGDQDVNRDGNDGSYLKCYMKEHPGVSIEQTREHVTQLISDAWKRLNQECLTETNPLPSSFTKLCLNAAQMVPLMYSYDTNSPSKLEEYVKSLLYSGGMQSIPEDQTIVS
ncbi:(3S,6E)-nerolidol synthase 1 [Spatholobus suberectus]|nr:(3S,6E)-nerolidol synthase 1 [Spatholobus suberectus]